MAEVDKITDGDVMGTKLHQGLEYFLWKMSLPNTPSYNINADLKYSVRMWFHNGIGNIFPNPFLVLNENEFGNFTRNYELKEHSHRGLQLSDANDGEGIELGELCFDLTPFVQSITLPNIGTTAETKVDTLLGNMQVGSYSPYTSDGGQEIQLTVIDTQYSILDAIFYPWLKMIGSPRWYDPNTAFEGHSTPYPICTVEISTPMRWAPEPGGTQEQKQLTPYVYQYIGARPKSYTIPEINAESRSSITRTLTMVCDLVIVDINGDSKLKKLRDESETISATPEGYSAPGAGPVPPVAPEITDAVPENGPVPTAEDVKNAEEDVNQAQQEADAAQNDANDQERNKEPGAEDATGPEPPVPPENQDETKPDEGQGGDQGGGGQEGGGDDQGGGEGPGPDEGGDGGEQPNPWQSAAAAVAAPAMDDAAAIAATAANIQSLLNASLDGGEQDDSGEGGDGNGGNEGGNNGGGNGGNTTNTNGDGGNGGDAGNGGDSGNDGSGGGANPNTNTGGGDSGGGSSQGGSGGTNPLTVLGIPARSPVAAREDDKSLFVCSAIKVANDSRRSIVKAATDCINDKGSDYVKSGVIGTMKDEIPQQFDSLVVGPIIDCVDNPSAMADLKGRILDNVDSAQRSVQHRYDYRLCDAKAVGNVIVEVQPTLRGDDVGNYGRVCTMNDAVSRIKEKLPDFRTNAAQSFFALKSLQALDRFPNASLSMHSEPDTDMWVVGAYLTPLHNALLDAYGLASDGNPPLPSDSYPFVLRHSWFKRDFTKEQEFATLRDALRMCETERKEMQLGADSDGISHSLESVSLWEIIDGNLNHTGVYWCKAWLVKKNASGEIVSGNVIFCKLNYLGSVLTDPFEFDESTMDIVAPGIIASKASFTKATANSIYSRDDLSETKKGGQMESHFNPLTAIVESKRFSLTREYKEAEPAGEAKRGIYDNMEPTGYVHIEEWPESGDAEYADETTNWFYTMSSFDEGELVQHHYRLEPRSAYEAQEMLDDGRTAPEDEPRIIVPFRFGTCLGPFHTESGKYGWLAVKRHGCWDGLDSAGEPYPTIHTTNSEEDMFDQYIPDGVEYVAQYRHHKTRWRTAKSEQAKLKQMIARVSARSLELAKEMKDGKDFVSEKVTEEKVNDLLETISRMDEISKAYNVLIELEVRQEGNLRELKEALASVSSKHAATPDTDLPEKLSIVDSLHLHMLSVSRIEEELGSIRDKQKELEAKYAEAKEERDEAIRRISDDIGKVYDVISSCMCDSWLIPLLTKGYNDALEYFKDKDDRRVKMERLVVFFDRRIAKIEEALADDPGNVSLADVILSCDWKAFGDWTTEDTEEIRRIREEANRIGYRLRVKRLIPSLRKKLEKAIKKHDALVEESMNATRLVYEPDYAYPGYVPKDDEQAPVTHPMSTAQAKALEKIIKEYKSFLTEHPNHLLKKTGSAAKKDAEKFDPLKKVIADYKRLMRWDGKQAFKAAPKKRDATLDKVIGEYRELTRGKRSVSVIEIQKKPEEKKRELLEVYRTLGSDFEDYSEQELENSLLLVLASEYLNSEDGESFKNDIVESRMSIERTKKAVEAYKKESDKEVRLIAAAKKKSSAIKESIDKLDRENLSMLRKFGTGNLPRDERSQFRMNTLKKADLMKSMDASDAVLKDIVSHYEQHTMSVLSSYANGLELARASYDKLMERLGDLIDFDAKVEQLYDAIFG